MLGELHALLEGLDQSTRVNAATAQSAMDDSKNAAGTSLKLQALVSSVEQLTATIDAMTSPVRQNIENGHEVRDNLRSLVTLTRAAEERLAQARERAQTILEIGEDFMVFVAEFVVSTRRTPRSSTSAGKQRLR